MLIFVYQSTHDYIFIDDDKVRYASYWLMNAGDKAESPESRESLD